MSHSHGALNILVNNASKQYSCNDLVDIDLEKVEDTFQSNIMQMIAITKYALPHMSKGDSYVYLSPFKSSTLQVADTLLKDH